MNATIGKNREGTLSDVISNRGEFAVPLYSSYMTYDQVMSGAAVIEKQIAFWSEEVSKMKFRIFSGDKKEAENITKIIDIQSQRLSAYYEALETLLPPEMTDEEIPGVPIIPIEPYVAPSTNYMPLLLGAAAVIAIVLYSKRKNRTA